MSSTAQLDAIIDELTVDAYNDDEQLSGLLVGTQDALRPSEPASIVGIEVQLIGVDADPDVRSGLTARVRRDGTTYEVALADLQFKADSRLGLIVAAYRHRQGRAP